MSVLILHERGSFPELTVKVENPTKKKKKKTHKNQMKGC